MADIKVVTRNNTLYVSGKAYPDGSNITASSSGDNVSIYDSNNNKYIVKNHPYRGIVDASGTNLAATAAATAAAVSSYINSSNPEGNIKNTDKITDLAGITASDFASKPGYGVFVGSTDGSLQTTPSFIFDGSNLDVGANMYFVGNKTIGSTGPSGTLTIDPATGINFFGSTNGYNFPTADGSSGQVLQTNGSGTLSFATVSSGGDVVDDTSPQLGGDLDLNGSDITGTGNINAAGLISSTLGYVTTGSITVGSITSNGSLSATSGNFGGDITTSGVNFAGSGTTTLAPISAGGSTPDDFEIRSNGNVTIVLDYDSNEAAQAFIVKNNAGTTIFQVDEDGISSGLLTTATPIISGAPTSAAQGSSVSGISISNFSSSNTYTGKVFNSSGVEQTSSPVTIDGSGNVSFTAPSTAATGYELRIFCASAGKLQSAESVSTFEVTVTRTFTHWRIKGYASAGVATADRIYLGDARFFEGTNQTGTEYPTTNMTSNTSESGITLSAGHSYSSSYVPWKATDQHNYTGWWTLGLSNAANNWWQIEFSTAKTFQSIEFNFYSTNTQADDVKLFGSNTGAFSGEEVEIIHISGVNQGTSGQNLLKQENI